MMLFNPRAALAEIEKRHCGPVEHQPPEVPTVARIVAFPEQKPGGEVIDTRAPPDATTQPCKSPLPPEVEELRHGFAVNGNPKTWTGKIVSLDAWRQLNEWDRHGPNGRHWCGATRAWVVPDGG
jgi:hypothetical protein